MSRNFKTSLVLVGPPTTGKSAIATAIASQIDGEIINADKFYLYKGFPHTTGLQSSSKYSRIRRHLYEILEPLQPCLTPPTYAATARAIERGIRSTGHPTIYEGCYHRFTRSIIDGNPMDYTLIGIRWSCSAVLEESVRQRITSIFSNAEAIQEVRNGLEHGFRHSYVMSKGSIIRPIVEFLLDHISIEDAKNKAIADVLYAAHKSYRRFLDFSGIKWHDHDASNTQSVVDSILAEWQNSNATTTRGRRSLAPLTADHSSARITYFDGVDSCGGPVRVDPIRFLEPFKSYGVDVRRLQEFIRLMDYTGNVVLPSRKFAEAINCISNEEARSMIEKLVYRNSKRNNVISRGRDYHLHLINTQKPEHEHLGIIRATVISNAQALSKICLTLNKSPQNLNAEEQGVVATLLDHQKQYAMVMLFGAYNALLIYEKHFRRAQANGDQSPIPAPVTKDLLDAYQRFCEEAIRNYYNFLVCNAAPAMAKPPEGVVRSFENVDLPVRTEGGVGDGCSKLVFRDFDHPGHLIYYAGNLLRIDGSENPIDCVINPLFGSIEVGYGLRAIFQSLEIPKIRDVRLIRFSRHNEHGDLHVSRNHITTFIPSYLEKDFLNPLTDPDKRLVMIDDAVGTGLTLVVLREYFRSHFDNPVSISAIEQDLSRTPANYLQIFWDYVYRERPYESKGRHETFVGYEHLAIPAIAHRPIKPIPGIIKEAIGLA